MSLVSALKRLPIDLGQANLRSTTKGKLIALDHVPVGNGSKALDIGCREGTQSKWLEARGYEVTSIDIESSYSRCKVIDVNGGLPFSDGSFDLIWCSEVIEHLVSPKAFAAECDRVLSSGGLLVLTTPNSAFWLYPLAKLFGKTAKDLQHPGHLHFFSVSDIKNLFPHGQIMGYFPYFLLKFRIRRLVGILSPTFVVVSKKKAS